MMRKLHNYELILCAAGAHPVRCTEFTTAYVRPPRLLNEPT